MKRSCFFAPLVMTMCFGLSACGDDDNTADATVVDSGPDDGGTVVDSNADVVLSDTGGPEDAGRGDVGRLDDAGVIGTQLITGSGFGAGPNVILFDSFSGGSDGDSVDLTGPEIGQWASAHNHASGFDGTLPTLRTYAGRHWMASRDVDNVDSTDGLGRGLRHVATERYDEFRIAFRTVCPPGFAFPGTTGPNQTDFRASNWKMNWFGLSDGGNAANSGPFDGPDLVIPTVVRDWHFVGGNRLEVRYFDEERERTPSMSQISGTHQNLYTYYQRNESAPDAHDGHLDWWLANGESGVQRSWSTQAAMREAGGPVFDMRFDMFITPGWMGNTTTNGGGGFANVLPLYSDYYLAIGPNSAAMVFTSNAATLAASTDVRIIPPDSWSDTEVTFSPRPWEDLGFRHLMLSNGVLLENL